MRVIDQTIMNRLFEVTDDLEVDREALQVPLLMEGDGKVERLPNGRVEITLPDSDDLGPFLAALPERLRGLMDIRGILHRDDTVPIRDKTDRFDP